VSSRAYVFFATLLLGACKDEFPNAPPLTLAIDTTSGWHDTVAVTDVDTLQIKVALAGGGTVTGVQVHWASSNPAKLEVTPLALQAGREKDSLILQLRTVITAHARDSVVIITAKVDRPGFEPKEFSRQITVMERWVTISAGYQHSCGITVSGDAFCWGEHDLSPNGGFLGNGSSAGSLTPVQVAGGLKFGSVAAGDRHTCGLSLDGRVYCWGLNSYGAAGNGSTFGFHQLSPVPIAVGRTFTAVSAGAGFVCGVTDDAQGFCWGLDDVGQLGDGGFDPILKRPIPRFDNCTLFESDTVRCSLTPRPVQTRRFEPILLRAAGAGLIHTCGALTDGRAVCWGSGSVELGNSLVAQTDTAVLVSGDTQLRSVSAGSSHTCGIGASVSQAYCWGFDSYGQLGTDSTLDSCVLFSGHTVECSRRPVLVSSGTGFRFVSAGGNASCGVATDSTAYCWGSNEFGQLGRASTITSCVPDVGVQVGCSQTPVRISIVGNPRFIAMSVGARHVCAVTSAGAAYCWGDGGGGKLGLGSTASSPNPVRVVEPR